MTHKMNNEANQMKYAAWEFAYEKVFALCMFSYFLVKFLQVRRKNNSFA